MKIFEFLFSIIGDGNKDVDARMLAFSVSAVCVGDETVVNDPSKWDSLTQTRGKSECLPGFGWLWYDGFFIHS